MSMNQYMHPRNIYKNPPDFKELAFKFPEFKKFVKLDLSGKVVFDFKDPEALRVLSCTLLEKDFNLHVVIPKNKLIPTIPLRLNYILWIEDLLNFIERNDSINGIDIGTGASCIYPLLAAKKNEWKMLATETDDQSIESAEKNVKNNELNHLISIRKITGDNILMNVINTDEEYDFCMCNPPFFGSTQELHPFFKARKLNRPHPKNAFVASVDEVVAKGGEVEFIKKLIEESQNLKNKVKIYTTMVGQKCDLPNLKKLLREAKVFSFKETEFCQGNTTRWGLAWTFLEIDLKKATNELKLVNNNKSSNKKMLLYEINQTYNPENLAKLTNFVLNIFKELEMTFEEVGRNKLHPRYFVTAYSNTWSNQRRKRREQLKNGTNIEEINAATNNNNNNNQDNEDKSSSSVKRTMDDVLSESTRKKLRLSTDSESSDTVGAFYKFIFALNGVDGKFLLELDTLDDFVNREYLHQIFQFVKNKSIKAIIDQ